MKYMLALGGLIGSVAKSKRFYLLLAVILAFAFSNTYFYYKGKNVAKIDCLVSSYRTQEALQSELNKAKDSNILLERELLSEKEKIKELRNSFRARLEEYEKTNPAGANTIILSDDWVRAINAAQKGVPTNNR